MPQKTDRKTEINNTPFTTRADEGIDNKDVSKNRDISKQKLKEKSYYIDGILSKDISILAQTITILESNSEKHFELGQDIISGIADKTGNSIRIGVTGAPGVGKSTFIDVLGMKLCRQNHKVAVLAVDPSSSISKGSILGDKTRMINLSLDKNAFIRPSPSGDNLGGVARKTRESILVCEAAGFDIIFVETIGVGQSEITVRSMVDFFLLLLLPGEGDELQGIKKGTVELADAIVINKADGGNINSAELTRQQYLSSIHYIRQATKGWDTLVETISAECDIGINELWLKIKDFIKSTKESGVFETRRKSQLFEWFIGSVQDELLNEFYKNSDVATELSHLKNEILENRISVSRASELIIKKFLKK